MPGRIRRIRWSIDDHSRGDNCIIIKCMRQFLSYIFRNPIFIVLVVCFIALLSLLFPAILPYSIPNISTGKHNLAVIIVGLVSVINCFLLYENLRSQKEQFEKNTFENSFFRLIEAHEKLVEDIHLWGRDTEVKGAKCFEYAKSQIQDISEILKRSTYLPQYNSPEDFEGLWDKINKSKDQKESIELLSTIQNNQRILNILKEYNITETVWGKNKEKPDEIDKNAFLIFRECKQSIYEQYFKSLNLLKKYWESRATDEERKKYQDIAFIHMSADESKFANWHLKYDGNCGRDKDKDKKA